MALNIDKNSNQATLTLTLASWYQYTPTLHLERHLIRKGPNTAGKRWEVNHSPTFTQDQVHFQRTLSSTQTCFLRSLQFVFLLLSAGLNTFQWLETVWDLIFWSNENQNSTGGENLSFPFQLLQGKLNYTSPPPKELNSAGELLPWQMTKDLFAFSGVSCFPVRF